MKQLNNRILIVVLLVLLAAFVLTRVFRSPALESNLDDDLLKVDTSGITAITLYPSLQGGKEIALVKEAKNWKVTQGGRSARVDASALNNLLRSMAEMKPERIISRKKERWNDYHVGDTTGIHVVALNGERELVNWWIGKTSGGFTYLRPDDEDETYAVGGGVRETVDKKFNDWRDKSFLRVKSALVTKISFHYPADSGFVIEKKDKSWMMGNEKTDSLKTTNYLTEIEFRDLSVFVDDFSPATAPDITMVIESSTAPLATVKAWRGAGDGWILTSDLQQDVYFSDTGAVTKALFVGREKLLVK